MICALMIRYVTDVLNMMQPVYVFIIFVLKRNVIDTIQGKHKKKRKPKSGPTSKTRINIIKNNHLQRKGSEATNTSNPAFSITFNKDTEITEVVPEGNVKLLSAQQRASIYEEIPLTIPNSKKKNGNNANDRLI